VYVSIVLVVKYITIIVFFTRQHKLNTVYIKIRLFVSVTVHEGNRSLYTKT